MNAAKPRIEGDLQAAYQVVVAHALSVYPHANSVRVVIDGPDGKAVLPVPMAPAFDDLKANVIATLKMLKPGEWMLKKTIAANVDRDPNNGALGRLLAQMAKDSEIESNRNLGYRLPQSASVKGDAA